VVGRLVNLRPSPGPAELGLIERCRRGERAALQEVFMTHAPYLERVLGRMAGPRLEVEDLLQSTFVAAIRAFPAFRGEAQVRTWLTRIAVRTTQERLRSAAHRRRGELPGLEETPDLAGRSSFAEHDLDARRSVERLYVHLGAIAPKKRIAFILHAFEGHPLEEVAALTGASLTATKSRVFWARRELLKRVARDPGLRELLEERRS
jgi:RNA polymerase sigma-70 factor (ECF subfamily)